MFQIVHQITNKGLNPKSVEFEKNHNISFSKIKQNEKVCYTGQKTEEQKDQPTINKVSQEK